MRDPTTRRVFGRLNHGRCRWPRSKAGAVAGDSVALGGMAQAIAAEPREHLHLAVNLRGDYTGAASAGFNLADVSTQSALRALPEGMKGIYWLGNGYNLHCSWQLSDQAGHRYRHGGQGQPEIQWHLLHLG